MPRAALAHLVAAALAGAGLAATGVTLARAADTSKADTKIVPLDEAVAILGHVVDGQDGRDLGRVVDVLIGQDGSPRAAVLDVGGFLGVGNRVVSVDWAALHFDPGSKDHPITTQLTPDQIRTAPEYKATARPATVVVAPKPKTEQ